LGQLGLGAPFLSGDKPGYPFFRALFGSSGHGDLAELAFGTDLKPLDLAKCNVSRIAPIELALGFELIQGLLACAGRLFEVAVSFGQSAAIFSNLLLGYRDRSSGSLALLVLPVIASIAFFLIADIDSPYLGTISVVPHNLISASEAMKP
jgi:hypothetical protein